MLEKTGSLGTVPAVNSDRKPRVQQGFRWCGPGHTAPQSWESRTGAQAGGPDVQEGGGARLRRAQQQGVGGLEAVSSENKQKAALLWAGAELEY